MNIKRYRLHRIAVLFDFVYKILFFFADRVGFECVDACLGQQICPNYTARKCKSIDQQSVHMSNTLNINSPLKRTTPHRRLTAMDLTHTSSKRPTTFLFRKLESVALLRKEQLIGTIRTVLECNFHT